MPTSTTPPTGLLTIAEAADKLGIKPWDVVRLTETGRLDAAIYVPASALSAYMQETTA